MNAAPDPGTVLGVLHAASGYLHDRGVDAPRLSAELLLAHVLGVNRMQVYLAHDRPMSEAERATLRPLIGERGRHVPVAYLLGEWGFYGLTLEVGPDVLIPRPETEALAELAIEQAPPGAWCVDLGTGSGALAIALAVKRPDVRVVAVDVSSAALRIARRNVVRHGVADRTALLGSDYWTALAGSRRFDLVVSNPPYVDPARADLLADDVRDHEPATALLTPPGDPGWAYRAIVAGMATHLAPGARVLMETGVGASEAALAVLEGEPELTDVELRNDLAGIPRYLVARFGE